MIYDIKTVNIKNCNARLNELYKIRDMISNNWELYVMTQGHDRVDAKFNEIVDEINLYLTFRRNNPGCLIEGDPGYNVYS
jgi:hypothetical protein